MSLLKPDSGLVSYISFGIALTLHLKLFIFLFTHWNMSLSCMIIELAVTPLALNAIIMLFHGCLYHGLSCLSFGIIICGTVCSHSCTEHFALSLPFGCFWTSSNWFLSCSLLWRCLFLIVWWLVIWVFHLLLNGLFSDFFDIKDLSFLNKDLLANLTVLHKSFFSKFAATSVALDAVFISTPIFKSILVVSRILIQRKELFLFLFLWYWLFLLFIIISVFDVALFLSSNWILGLLLWLWIWIPTIVINVQFFVLIIIAFFVSSVRRDAWISDSMRIRIKTIIIPSKLSRITSSLIILLESTISWFIVVIHLLLGLWITIFRVSTKYYVINLV